MDLGNLLFSFQGRINRAKYWLVALISLLLWIPAVALMAVLGFAGAGARILAAVIVIAFFVVTAVWGVAAGIKRLHDRDKSGWWLLLFYLVPGILDGVGRGIGGAGLILNVVAFAVSIWAIVELGCRRGTVGPNSYGPDPLADAAVQPA